MKDNMNQKHFFLVLIVLAMTLASVAACAAPATPAAVPPQEVTRIIEKVITPTAGAPQPPQEVTRVIEKVVTPTAAPTTAAKKGGTLIFAKAQEAAGLDPHLVTAVSSRAITALVYGRLVALNSKFELVPELAEKWDNPNPTTYTFNLRKGVKFHNGREMKAADVKYSFQRILDPAVASSWASSLSSISSIDTPDDYTVTFTMKEPFGAFLSTITADWAAIVPQEVVKQFGDLQTHMVGTGPFTLSEYVQNTRTVLKAFPDYWGGAPLLEGVTFQIIPDESARLAALRTGQVQLAQLSDPAAVGMAARSEGVKVLNQATTDYYHFSFNTTRKPFSDVRVRQAISLATDRKAVMDAVVFGDAQVSGVLPPTMGDWAVPAADLPYFKPDIAKAKALLAEAGYPNGFEFTLLASPQYPQFPSIGLVVQSQLKQIGVKVNVDQIEWGNFLSRWRARDFEAFVSFNASGSDPDYAMYRYLFSSSSFNATQIKSPDLDTPLAKGRASTDRAQRLTLYRDAQKLAAEQAPTIFLFTRTEYVGVRDNVQSFSLSPVDTFAYKTLAGTWLK